MKDNFSDKGDRYLRYRPGYPEELFNFIFSHVSEKDLAWDVGTGNGQSAVQLAAYFTRVHASDISSSQLGNATAAPNIFYLKEFAEHSRLDNDSVDLITISQALHWFDHKAFYDEVRRVSKQTGIIAAWTYSLLKINEEIDPHIEEYHFATLKNYWDAERKHVDNGYSAIPFPFRKIEAPGFQITLNWTLKDLHGYLNTWSALKKFISLNNYSPSDNLVQNLVHIWPPNETLRITFPLHLLIGYVH